LQALPEIVLPPLVNGASYSHYVIRVEERQQFVDALRKKGVQLGLLIDYSVPHMNAYKNFANSEEFPNSKYCSEHMINLPIFPDLSFQQRDYIIECLKSIS
jgi:dTDP-4-amino-4,6-dideoxygalactose transaminase